MRGPGDRDFGEGLWDEEAIPGFERPGSMGEGVEGADPRSLDQLCELGCTGFGDHGRPAWAVGGKSAVMTCEVGVGHLSKRSCAAA